MTKTIADWLILAVFVGFVVGVFVTLWVFGLADWIKNKPFREQRVKLRGIRQLEADIERPLADVIKEAEDAALRDFCSECWELEETQRRYAA